MIFHDKTVLAHERADLVCEVTPITAATVVWMKENEAINESQRVKFVDHALVINSTTESDAGYYTCIVKTAFGTKRKTAYLTVTEDEGECLCIVSGNCVVYYRAEFSPKNFLNHMTDFVPKYFEN